MESLSSFLLSFSSSLPNPNNSASSVCEATIDPTAEIRWRNPAPSDDVGTFLGDVEDMYPNAITADLFSVMSPLEFIPSLPASFELKEGDRDSVGRIVQHDKLHLDFSDFLRNNPSYSFSLPTNIYNNLLQSFCQEVTTDESSDRKLWVDTPVSSFNGTSTSSSSIHRKPDSYNSSIRGSIENLPFAPGGVSRKDEIRRAEELASYGVTTISVSSNKASTGIDHVAIDVVSTLSVMERHHLGQKYLHALLQESLLHLNKPAGVIIGVDIYEILGINDRDVSIKSNKHNNSANKNMSISSILEQSDIELDSSDESSEEEEEKKELTTEFSVNNVDIEVNDTGNADFDSNFFDNILENDEWIDDIRRRRLMKRRPGAGLNSTTLMTAAELSSLGLPSSDEGDDCWAVASPYHPQALEELVPKMAMEFPFSLDPFQRLSVIHLERGDCLCVAAHTSAGKTVVAEYAIALCFQHMTKAIYTSPIKTLSNQKYHDLRATFTDVGLLTGDVSINPEAQVVVMTTEILRSMLYRGADMLRDVEWVIFDEVHYITDADRGVVWEEVIIMLPPHISLVALSATVPNVGDFADWIGRTKQRKVYVVATSKRPVPLQHVIYHGGKIFTVMDTAGKVNRDSLVAVSNAIKGNKDKDKNSQMNRGRPDPATERRNLVALIKFLETHNMLPSVIFLFSRKKVEDMAAVLGGFASSNSLGGGGGKGVQLSSHGERSKSEVFFRTVLRSLSANDRQLPQVLRIHELALKGIGVHHSGLLPIMKEAVEMLFARGLIKVLFATETFAMGVNMPAKSTVFPSIRKHDGNGFRDITPGEYIQMAGRAGRRGQDLVGTVIIALLEDKMIDETGLMTMMTGRVAKLSSQFRLTYNMILNLLRVEDFDIITMLRRSFKETDSAASAPDLMKMLADVHSKSQEAEKLRPDCIAPGGKKSNDDGSGTSYITKWWELSVEIAALTATMQKAMSSAPGALKVLTPGRVILICQETKKSDVMDKTNTLSSSQDRMSLTGSISGNLFGVIAVITKVIQSSASASLSFASAESLRSFAAIAICAGDGDSGAVGDVGAAVSPILGRYRFQSIIIHFCDILNIYHDRIDIGVDVDIDSIVSIAGQSVKDNSFMRVPPSITIPLVRLAEHRHSTFVSNVDIEDSYKYLKVDKVKQMDKSKSSMLRPFNPIQDLRITDLDYADSFFRRQDAIALLSSLPCEGCPKLGFQLAAEEKRQRFIEITRRIKWALSDDKLHLLPEFGKRVQLLQTLMYVDASKIVLLKGRVACCINTCDELLLTELIMSNELTALSPPQLASILSAFVFQDRTETAPPSLTPELRSAWRVATAKALDLGALQRDYGINIDPEEYAKLCLNCGLMEVVYEWALGRPFYSLCDLTAVLEGTIVRTVVRVAEALRDVRNAARVIGNQSLSSTAAVAIDLIKRDICFSASLYYKG